LHEVIPHPATQFTKDQPLTDLSYGIVALSTPAPKSLLLPAGSAIRTVSASAEKKAEVPIAQRSGTEPSAPIPRAPRREVPLPSQEGTNGVVQYAL